MAAPVSFTIRPPAQSHSTHQDGSSSSNSGPLRIPIAQARPGPRVKAKDPRARIIGRQEDDEADEEDADSAFGGGAGSSGRGSRDERIFGFGENGIEGCAPTHLARSCILTFAARRSSKPSGPMVIPSMPNRDWRQSSMARNRKPGFVPDQAGPTVVKPEDLVERSNDGEVQAGLQMVKSEQGDQAAVVRQSLAADTIVKKEEEPESIEDRARKALLESAANPDGEEAARFRNMVIGNADDSSWMDRPADEADAFRRDVLTRPEEVRGILAVNLCSSADASQSTMEDYEHTPIEAFGAALLRGMGWNPDATPGQAVHVPKRRPAGLGLGATAKVISEEDSKNKKNSRKLKEEALGKGYLPVIKRELSSAAPSATGTSRSGHTTRSPSPERRRAKDDRNGERDRSKRDDDRERRYESSSSRGDSRRYDDRRSERSERDRESSRHKQDSRQRDRARDDYDDRYRTRDRDSERDRHRDRYDERDRNRDRERRR